MKRFSLALIPALLSSAAFANFTDTAQVVSVTPIMDRVNAPRQECWTEQVSAPTNSQRQVETVQYNRSSTPAPSASSGGTGAGAIIGAIIGGVVGHQFGNSTGGKDRGTVAGAVIGGLVGNAVESGANTTTSQAPSYGRDVQPSVYSPTNEVTTRTVERCRTINEAREQVSGYNVTYRYGNQQFTTRMAQDPGATLRVRVNVTPEITR